VKIQATAAIPERRRGRETRDASARLECYRCADTTNQWWGVCATRRRRAL